MKIKKNAFTVALIATLLIAITITDTVIVFRMTSDQIKESGSLQLEAMSGELEGMINEAEKYTLNLAMVAEKYLDDRSLMDTFIRGHADEVKKGDSGAFNVYIANYDWTILPGLDDDEDFVATERIWYTGAAAGNGKTFVTPPYIDVVTGNICYTVSVLLNDKETVLGVDYTMDNIRAHIDKISSEGASNAVIVTDDGIIIGYSEEEYIGKRLTDVLPDYAGIFSLAKKKNGVQTARIKADYLYESLFAARSSNGWVIIVSESDWELYKSSYIQLIVTLLLSTSLFALVIVLYVFAKRNQQKAEDALESKEEFLLGITNDLHGPLTKILESSKIDAVENTEDFRESFVRIHESGEKLSEMIDQIVSYSYIVNSEKEQTSNKKINPHMNRRFTRWILIFMVVVMAVSLYVNTSATIRWGDEMLEAEGKEYEYELSEWINTQKSVLDMYCSLFSTNPELLDDHDEAVEMLRKITLQYPEISVCYMANPDLERTVIMNNGWEPDDDWKVEERQWYIDTMNSDEGWSISAPYYDEQTGGYCITVSKRVYSSKNGDFLGVFGIDFFMDKLVDILGDSYSEDGYAFLVDTEGNIINHPYGSYQMTQNNKTNVSELPYGQVKIDDRSVVIRDYDNSMKIVAAIRNETSKFKVYVVSDYFRIYSKVYIYGLICLVIFILCIILVNRMLKNLISWQDETNRIMKEAAETAIAAGRAKSQFLAQVSHEIRTPINAVLGMNEMIIRESTEDNIVDYSENIRAAGKTLLSIINSILDFSKIEDGKMDIIPVKYDLASMINNLVHSISDRAKAKNLRLDIVIDESLPATLYGDDVRVSQVIMNLLTNAVKYTEKGTVTMSIKDGGRFEDSIFLDVTVRDTGIGIKEEDMGKLFKSFERIDEKKNRNIEGTGLGMAIVTRLLEMMDSKLSVESTYGQGSSFSFRIKQMIVDNEAIGNYEERVELQMGEQEVEYVLFAPDARILLVDDNDMNLKVIKSLLKINGINADTAMSGKEAIEKINKRDYDIIFLDHIMPGMDGVETYKNLRRNNLLKEGVSVIALTANAVVGAKEKYISEGFNDYLSKPIDVGSLTHILKTYLPEEIVRFVKKEDVSPRGKKQGYSNEEFDTSGLPTISGVDWGYAAKHLPMMELLLETVKDFYDAIDMQAEKLEKLYSKFPDEDEIMAYHILIHSMKSTTAMIGIIPLSGMAKVLEDASDVNDIYTINALHPIYIRELKSYKDKLKKLVGDDKKAEDNKKAIDGETLRDLLVKLRDCTKDYDVDGADKVMKEVNEYFYPDELKDKIDRLSQAVLDIDDDLVFEIIDEIMEEE